MRVKSGVWRRTGAPTLGEGGLVDSAAVARSQCATLGRRNRSTESIDGTLTNERTFTNATQSADTV